jgi:hypothetical protein
METEIMQIKIPLAEMPPTEYRKIAEWIRQLPVKNPVTVRFTKEELLMLAEILAEA